MSSSPWPDRFWGRSRSSLSTAVLVSSAASLQSTFVSPARTLLSMGYYGAMPEKLGEISPRFLTPGRATVVSAIAASTFYTLLRFVSTSVLWDTVQTLGAMIAFYLRAHRLRRGMVLSREMVLLSEELLLHAQVSPGLGGLILFSLLEPDPEGLPRPGSMGRDAQVFGVGLVFVLTLALILLGVVLMLVQYVRAPAFFRGEVIARSDAVTEEMKVATVYEDGDDAYPLRAGSVTAGEPE